MSAFDFQLRGREASVYEPPLITRLGTLAELTLGSDGGPEDAFAGQDGSIPT